MSATKLGVLQASVTYANSSAVFVGNLPANAYITSIKCIVTTAFSAGDVIDIGVSGTANKFSDNIDVDAVGAATVTLATAGLGVQSTTAATAVYATYVATATGSDVGAAEISVEYAYKE